MFRGSGYKIILFMLGLPLLFGFALYNRVKSAEMIQPSPRTTIAAPAVSPRQAGQAGIIQAVEPARPAATPTVMATRRPARPAALPTATSPAKARPEEDRAIPLATASDPLLSPTATQKAETLDPLEWKQWPVVPQVSDEMRAVYQRGLENGNDPRAFSVLGDCQSLPEVFMGVFDEDPTVVAQLPGPWQETVTQFQGSFNRYSPTVKDGTTEGALLWAQWNDNKEKKCQHGESPLDCELRVQRPSIVFVHVGTHWEARNRHYLEIILNKILEHGAVPVLVTKADNREKDERVNENYSSLAAEYGVPLWNFWYSVQNLPDHGMEPNSDMYLNEAGLVVHRMGALQVLDAVWRSVR